MTCPECKGTKSHRQKRRDESCPLAWEQKLARDREHYWNLSGVQYNLRLLKSRRRKALKRMELRHAGLCDSCGSRPIAHRAQTKCEECLDAQSIRGTSKTIAKYTELLGALENREPWLMEQLGLTREAA